LIIGSEPGRKSLPLLTTLTILTCVISNDDILGLGHIDTIVKDAYVLIFNLV
jgi:hypothetical protein